MKHFLLFRLFSLIQNVYAVVNKSTESYTMKDRCQLKFLACFQLHCYQINTRDENILTIKINKIQDINK